MTNSCGYTPSAGVQLLRADRTSGSTIWETIGGVQEMPQINMTAGTGQCNDFDSAASGFAEYFKNGNFTLDDMTFTLGMRETDPVQEKLDNDILQIGTDAVTGESELVGFRLIFPTADLLTFEWNALVVGWGIAIPTPDNDDNKITKPFSIKPSGGLTKVV